MEARGEKKEPERRTVCYVYFDIHSFESVLMLLMRNYEMGLCFFSTFICLRRGFCFSTSFISFTMLLLFAIARPFNII